MAEYIAKDGEERGALMLEAIALLGLMTMMSPMVVRQTADRTAEMEEVAVAGQMKTLRDAVSSYIEANYANIAAEGGNTRAVTLDQLRPYLPPSFIQGGAVSNKLINDYDFRLRKECTDGAAPNCNRWKIMGLVVSGRANDGTAGGAAELDVRRAARIATMIGADGGYTPSTDSGQNGNVIHGAQGIWEGNVTDFGIAADSAKGRVVAATTYASSVGGDFLYRHAVNGLPEANSMFTDIDMSGQGTGAHRIRHSGGLEVINGKIVVRRSRVNDWNSNNNEAVHIDQNKIESSEVDVSMTKGDTRFRLNNGSISAGIGWNKGFSVDEYATEMRGNEGSVNANNSGVHIQGTYEITQSARDIRADAQDMQFNSGFMSFNSSGSVYIRGGGDVQVASGSYGLSISPNNGGGGLYAQNQLVGGLSANNRIVLSEGWTSGLRMSADIVNENETRLTLYDGNQQANFYVSSGEQLSPVRQKGAYLYMGAKGKKKVEIYANDTEQEYHDGHPMMKMYGSDRYGSIAGYEAAVSDEGGYLQLGHARGGDLWDSFIIRLTSNDGEVMASHLRPRRISIKRAPSTGDDYGFPVQNHTSANYTEQGTTPATDTTLSVGAGQETIENQLTNTDGRIYKTYGANTVSESVIGKSVSYDKFEVDPAFVSVMNDIKLTSRGGAHLADILPNYINKGIYVLSNTYASGPWPCDSSNCRFKIPRVKKSDDGAIVTGAWESDCGAMKNYLKGTANPSMGGSTTATGTGAGNSQCKNYDKYMEVSYYNGGGYTQCPAGQACLTHPYLGAVPAPGRSVNDGTGEMAAYDEGPCPDGYLPVMTVTPTAIEVGKVNHIDMRIDLGATEEDNYVYYNLENIDFSSNRASIYQPATSVSTAVISVNKSGTKIEDNDTTTEVAGWKVALGTVSTSTSNGYYWNQGGVWQDSMKAVAHTYCYFNPSRFKYPNMVIDNKVMKAMPAPRKWNN